MLHTRRRAVPIGALSAALVLAGASLLVTHTPSVAGPPATSSVRSQTPAASSGRTAFSPGPARTPLPPLSLPGSASPATVRGTLPPVAPGAGRPGTVQAVPPARPGFLSNVSTFSAPLPPGRIRVADGPFAVHYDFNGGVGRPISDSRGGHELRPLGQNGGALRLVPQGSGLAVAYPDRCTLPREWACPRAILEGLRDDSLNPGRRPLRYGASIRMTHADLADGANVLQKGYSVGGVSQYKLQVDHRQGHPSCVIASQRAHIYRAEPWVDVADGTWHDLECRRTPTRLIMLVDGTPRAWVPVPPQLTIANAEPLRVGGKGPAPGNDQFAGAIDDVFIAIGD
ncbi:LamG domain-containing protein [Actinoplanes sp. NEAU-A12]|uniref:LamG domain-containing protein n=1 Tax=Actinoplanes sandaracinus TaxID=3045177 RepID=A0ABT6WT42_9ACTN|nr:LamG-like jellyroll fold domain-containing protein [Actinoplanes sandaracinus]MDI6099017.1 LamG domain-containing protein [Actinoplanes sandaracinus]MDI6102912.1 LamG domain-containing protein [Actinoplanes sandaracinus]